ncbi:MAG: DEAD/DEAH box helicase [Myxococcota bacterium]
MRSPQMPLDFSDLVADAPPSLAAFHPLVVRWFLTRLGEPSEPQVRGWPLIREGEDVLIAAPTGSGKTLSAFLACLDELFRLALEGALPDETRVVYVSPLKALGNDVQKNLLAPLEELYALSREVGLSPQPIRVLVRTGDTKASERAAMVKKPPHILITTPESLYLYLTAQKSRATLKAVRTVVVDEIHALARDKRGSHFTLSLARLSHLTQKRPQLIGLSATVRPLDEISAFLTGQLPAQSGCARVEVGHLRPWDIRIETPEDELSAVATHEMWGQIYDRIEALAQQHRTILIFANTRRLAERVAHDLGLRLGHEKTAAHHGSMARELRLSAEERLKNGQLSVMVATASLELGIDIGAVDLVVQLGSPRAIAVALQRVGRAGHYKGGISKGILFALTRDELVECTALLWAIRQGDLDAVRMPKKPLDILAQQVVAEVSAQEWDEDELYQLFRRAWPYQDLTFDEYEKVLHMVSEGVATSRGRSRVHLHRDRVNGWLRPRKAARITALTNGGAIPDTFTYPVIAEPEEKQVGTLDEDFAVESMAGDVFLLGSTSWRIRRIEGSTVRVENAKGAAPTVPFWRGEAPSRTDELSAHVGKLREAVLSQKDAPGWLEKELGLSPACADLLVRYLRAAESALGAAPSQECVVAERFFDEAGGMQLILHAPFGGRVNRAWGLALRKRFCRTFDFELQAAASDDGILLSLGEQHSFPLADIFDFLSPSNVEEVLTQALLQTPLFPTRFRWNSTRALALSRFSMGKRVPPHLQRARAEDLLAAVFPAQVGCQDNHGGEKIEPPDHPLVNETLDNCLREAMDVDGLKAVLQGMKEGRIRTVAVDLPEPSVLAHQMLNSAPYTYLDEAPLEERRARAVSVRRTLPPADAAAFGALDAEAIAQVVSDARPPLRDAEELHDALLQLCFADVDVLGSPVRELFAQLATCQRAATFTREERTFAVAAERVAYLRALFPEAELSPPLQSLPGDGPVTREVAALAVVRGWMEVVGPLTAAELAHQVALPHAEVEQALFKLESEGQVLRGHFRPAPLSPWERARVRDPKMGELPPLTPTLSQRERETEWCDRRLLQRIHRQTVGRLRAEIQPLSPQDFMRFLFRWHHLEPDEALRGTNGLLKAVTLLQGYEAPAAAWEQWLLPARMKYLPELLERACWSGEVAWGRLTLKESRSTPPGPRRGAVAEPPTLSQRERVVVPVHRPLPGRSASITFVRREEMDWLLSAARPRALLADGARPLPEELSHPARDVAEALERRGASFFTELVAASRRLPAEVEDALWELLSFGLVTADAVENLRVLQSPKARKRQKALRRGGPGRWSLLLPTELREGRELEERLAKLFLHRYGIVFRDLVLREPLCPSWRELLYVYRRLEARGEIRGGRFLAGFAGEQFALPEAVELARSVRRAPTTGHVVHLAAVDPLNLTGVVTPGPRVSAQLGNFVTYVDGLPQTDVGEAATALR